MKTLLLSIVLFSTISHSMQKSKTALLPGESLLQYKAKMAIQENCTKEAKKFQKKEAKNKTKQEYRSLACLDKYYEDTLRPRGYVYTCREPNCGMWFSEAERACIIMELTPISPFK